MQKLLSHLQNNSFLQKIWTGRFPIFILVGMINTVFGYLAFAFFIFLGFHYTWAVLLTTCVGVLFNFKTTGRIVFKNKSNKLLINFILVYTIVYFMTIGYIKLLSLFIANMYIAGAIASLCMPLISFILYRKLVFSGVSHEVN